MRGSTFLLGLSSFDSWNAGKNLIFFSLSFFLSPSVRFSFSHFFSFLLSPFLSIEFPFLCVCSSPPFLFIFHFLIFSFSPFFLSFSHFFSSPFVWLLFSLIHRIVQVGKFPTTFLLCHFVTLTFFSLNFYIFLFPLFLSFDTWLNVNHSHKCTTWLMPCVTPLGCHVSST